MERSSSSIEEDYIIVAPQEAGEEPEEYCAQDESRPKLFGSWGPIIPLGKAVTSLLSSFLDSKKYSNSDTLSNVTVDLVSDTRHYVVTSDDPQTSEQDVTNSGSGCNLATRRASMKKQNAFSSFGESNEYALQKFKLHSKDHSTDDFLILKVRTSSLASLHSPSAETHLLSDVAKPEQHSVGNGNVVTSTENISDVVENDGPAFIHRRRCSDRLPGSNLSSGVLLKRQMGMEKKSYSLPARTELYSPDSFVAIDLECPTKSLPVRSVRSNGTVPLSSNGTVKNAIPSEQKIKEIVTQHCPDFVKYSNWAVLLPLLEASCLLDPTTRDKLMNSSIGDHDKGVYFYIKALPSQGKLAYTTFYKCLMKEKEHKGHKTLQDYLCPSSSS